MKTPIKILFIIIFLFGGFLFILKPYSEVLASNSYTNTQTTLTSSGVEYTIKTLTDVPGITADEGYFIFGSIGTDSNSGTEDWYIKLGSSVIYQNTQTSNYYDYDFEIFLLNRNSTSSQYYNVKLYRDNAVVLNKVGTLSLDFSTATTTLNLTAKVTGDTGRKATSNYFGVNILRDYDYVAVSSETGTTSTSTVTSTIDFNEFPIVVFFAVLIFFLFFFIFKIL